MLTATDERFERPADFSAPRFLLSSLLPDSAEMDTFISIQIDGSEPAFDDLSGHCFLAHGLVERSQFEAHFKLEEDTILHQLPYFLLNYGGKIQLKEPQFLKQRMVEVTMNLYKYYEAQLLH